MQEPNTDIDIDPVTWSDVQLTELLVDLDEAEWVPTTDESKQWLN